MGGSGINALPYLRKMFRWRSSELNGTCRWGGVRSRLVIVDFMKIDNLGGHSYEYDRNVVTAFLARGWECVIYAPRSCRLDFLAGAQVRPLFSYSATDTIVRAKLLRPFVKFIAHNTKIAKQIGDVVSAEDSPGTVFYAQHVEQFQLWALYRALTKPLLGQLVIMLRVTSFRTAWHHAKPTWRTVVYWLVLRRLRRLGAKIVLVTDSELLQKEYQALTPIRIDVVPHPNPPLIATGRRGHGVPLCIASVGRLDLEKGSQYLPKIMAAVQRESILARFTIYTHVGGGEHSERYESLKASIRANARTEDVLIETPVPTEDYWRQLKTADIVLMLYDPSRYRNQISGVLMDALAAGCFPIVSDDTWLAHVVRNTEFGAIVRLDGSVAESVAAILKAGIPKTIPRKVVDFVRFHSRDNFFTALTSITQRKAI